MKFILAGILVGAALAGCSTPQPAKSSPGAILRGSDLPSVEHGAMAAANTPPVPIKMQNPIYPYELRKQKIEGKVLVEFVVNTSGRVVEAHAVEWTHPDMAQAAVTAILNSEFQPAIKEGKPAAAKLRAPIFFSLQKKDPP